VLYYYFTNLNCVTFDSFFTLLSNKQIEKILYDIKLGRIEHHTIYWLHFRNHGECFTGLCHGDPSAPAAHSRWGATGAPYSAASARRPKLSVRLLSAKWLGKKCCENRRFHQVMRMVTGNKYIYIYIMSFRLATLKHFSAISMCIYIYGSIHVYMEVYLSC